MSDGIIRQVVRSSPGTGIEEPHVCQLYLLSVTFVNKKVHLFIV